MEQLSKILDDLLNRLDNAEELRAKIEELISVYPFNKYEYIISHLLASGKFTLDEYSEIRNEYIDRNLYLYLFEMSAPRGFGELWAQGHLKEFVPSLQRPNKMSDPEYQGQYDFLLPPSIRIEVKASRAVAINNAEPLYIKALSFDSAQNFDMNFQQIKPKYCDVFVWLAVWRDIIKYWVMPSHVVENSKYYSKGQHRGNVGEGQLHFNKENIGAFNQYVVDPRNLEDAIRKAHELEIAFRNSTPESPD